MAATFALSTMRDANSALGGLISAPLVAATFPLRSCEIIGDLAYLVSPLCPCNGIRYIAVIWIWESSYRTFVLTYILAIGFKTPTRGFSRFARNLN